MQWGFSTAKHLRFGRDVSTDLVREARSFGVKVLVVTGATPTRFSNLIDGLEIAGLEVQVIPCPCEPELSWIEAHLEGLRNAAPEVVIGLGGGSAIDAAKALAALIANPGDPLRYLEVVGEGRALERDPLPMIAVPTTSGTGAEVTKNAVISVPESRRKVSLRDDRMLPNLALVDPVLTIGLPRDVTAATGLDALTQVIEPYLSSRANPMTDALCREGIARAANALPKLLKGGENVSLREDMSLASVFGGMALANLRFRRGSRLGGGIGRLVRRPARRAMWALVTSSFAGEFRGGQDVQ